MFLANKQKKTQDEEKKKPDPSSAAEKTNGCTASESGSGSGNSVLGVLKNGGAKSQQGTPPAVRRVMTGIEGISFTCILCTEWEEKDSKFFCFAQIKNTWIYDSLKEEQTSKYRFTGPISIIY